MEAITLPTKIELKPTDRERESMLVVEPLHRGYGQTLGNAIRRVLLSSLPGAAVTSVKIKGVTHEFSTVPHVKEDVLEMILNLKMIRLKLFVDEPVKLTLKAKGEGEVTAADFSKDSNVEIANPDLVIAHLTDKAAALEMEVIVEKGMGYMPTEERKKEGLEVGSIAIDAVFGPIKNVAMKVEDTRVGQDINFDKLTLTIETDGTISATKAVKDSVKILLDHFNLFMNLADEEEVAALKKSSKKAADSAEEAPKKKRGRAKKA